MYCTWKEKGGKGESVEGRTSAHHVATSYIQERETDIRCSLHSVESEIIEAFCTISLSLEAAPWHQQEDSEFSPVSSYWYTSVSSNAPQLQPFLFPQSLQTGRQVQGDRRDHGHDEQDEAGRQGEEGGARAQDGSQEKGDGRAQGRVRAGRARAGAAAAAHDGGQEALQGRKGRRKGQRKGRTLGEQGRRSRGDAGRDGRTHGHGRGRTNGIRWTSRCRSDDAAAAAQRTPLRAATGSSSRRRGRRSRRRRHPALPRPGRVPAASRGPSVRGGRSLRGPGAVRWTGWARLLPDPSWSVRRAWDARRERIPQRKRRLPDGLSSQRR